MPRESLQEKSPAIENNISSRRFGCILWIVLTFAAGNVALAYTRGLLIDAVFCVGAVSLAYLLVFILALMKQRLLGGHSSGTASSYQAVALVMTLVWLYVVFLSDVMEFFVPFIAIVVILTAVMEESLALATGIYFVFVITITQSASVYVCLCYCLLCIFGVLLSPFFKESSWGNFFCIQLVYFLLNVLIPVVFYYISYLDMDNTVFLYGLGLGLINALMMVALYKPLYALSRREVILAYDIILDEEYSLVRELRRFSTVEYNHALRVSRIAGNCARLIEADVDVARCAGFYYRIGKLEGEPEIDNALRLANNHCFPKEVISVLAEYGAILERPTSKESAIVHMVDVLVTKAELLDQDLMASAWNQDMVIYQTLNELSAQGLYDASTLSMNQFLQIREFLVQKESLL